MEQYAFDLHLHSCLSPCGGEDNTPANLAGMCALAGIEVAALTDHNTCGNCAAFCRAAEHYGLLALPGMELTTAEEAHVVCLFPGLKEADAFSALVREKLPPIENNPAVFGPQLYMDEEERVLGEETAFLAGASSIGIYDTAALAASFGGVAFPAHIDRPSFSLLGVLGVWDPGLNFPLAELSHHCPPDFTRRRDLAGLRFITSSDAHYLDQIRDAHQYMALPARTPQAVLAWLRAGIPPSDGIS